MKRRAFGWRHQLAVDRVREFAPGTLLDVACGDGWLLDRTREQVAFAVGVERDVARAAAVVERSIPAVRADATALPFVDRRFDLVVLRNVLHHFPDPAAALAEAARVSRGAMLITEPWFDLTDESQRLGDKIERWTRTLERRAGRYHAENLDADEITAILPFEPREVDVRHRLEVETRTRDEWLEDVTELIAALPEDEPALFGLHQIDEELHERTSTAEGAMVMVIRW